MTDAPSPFSPTTPNFQTTWHEPKIIAGVLVFPKRLNRFVRWLHIHEDGCWLYQGPRTHNGYGAFGTGGRRGKNVRAHRFAFELRREEIASSKLVLHTCDIRNCCNPAHLFIGTPKDNTADMVNKGRAFKGNPSTWTDEMADVAILMRTEGASCREIGEVIERSHETVRVFLKGCGL